MKRTTRTLLATLLAICPALTAQDAAIPEHPTFTEHVAEIVFRNCASCHRPGEIGPFPLLEYADVAKRGRMIARVTARGYMPPWHPVEGHGSFEGEARLTAAEIETIRRWVEAGVPEGDPAHLPPRPAFTDGWQLGEPDLVLRMAAPFAVPAGGPDIYRNFVIPIGLDEERWISAIEVRPGSRSALHHVIFGVDTSGRARRLDGQDGQPGFSGMGRFGGENVGTSTAGLGGWAVGGMPRHLPLGLAFRLPAGADLVLRSHLHPSGKAEQEQTTIGLHFADAPPERTMAGLQLPPMFGVAAGLDVPAGETLTLRDAFTLPVDALALTVGGHAHMICETMQLFVTRPGEERTSLFLIDDWDFDWQNRYTYREPVVLPAGTRVEVEIHYDNTPDNLDNPFDPPRRIRWGLQSTDEMGSITLLLVAADEQDSGTLQRAIREHARQSMRGGAARQAGSAALISRIRMLDADADGRITMEELPERWRRIAARLDTDGDGALDDTELEALERLGRGR